MKHCVDICNKPFQYVTICCKFTFSLEYSEKLNYTVYLEVTACEGRHKIKKMRVQRGLSQSELAESISIDRSMISLYENDHREIPTSTAKLIASYFNVSVDYLLGIDTARNSDTQKTESERTVSQSILICLMLKNRIAL